MKELTAKDVMTPHVLSARADWPLSRLAEFLIENDIHGAPVTNEDGTLVGVVSMTDIVRHDSSPQKQPSLAQTHDYYLPILKGQYAAEEVTAFRIDEGSEATVEDIMTPMIFQVEADMPIPRVAEQMVRGRIHRVLVTEGETVIGIISALGLLAVVSKL